MDKSIFKQNLIKWLETEGLSVIGEWDIEEKNDSAKIIVKAKINGKNNIGCSITENKEETIETAVLALNDELIKRLSKNESV